MMFEKLKRTELKEILGGKRTPSTYGTDGNGFYEQWWEDGYCYRRYLTRIA